MEQLLQAVSDTEKQRRVLSVVLGLGYIAVELEGSRVGLSANIADTSREGCSVFSKAGTLKGLSAGEALGFFNRDDLLSRSFALATLNALKASEYEHDFSDVFDHVSIHPSDSVAMVGFIAPIAALLQDKGARVSVFENRALNSPIIKPKQDMEKVLAEADIIIITATTLVNNTLWDILAYPKAARDIILMGPSTPMIPEAFISTPITHLAGSLVIDRGKAFQIVMEGGGTQALYRSNAMKKIHREVHQ